MAIPSGSGSEILQSKMWEDVTSSSDPTFTLVPLHIYTILSATFSNMSGSTAGTINLYLWGYDSYGSANGQYLRLCRESVPADGTFVFNDKIVIHGQGSNNAAQKIIIGVETVTFDVSLSYIDQDWT